MAITLRAFKTVNQVCPEWTLDIIGEGEDKARLQSLINYEKLNRSVRLMPAISDIENVYLGASVVAMSSHYEGLPMVLLEAQSFGLPIVAFACQCGPKDVITDGETGFLVPEGEVEGLADRLITVMEDDNLRLSMGKKAKEASHRYEERGVMQLWMETFQTVMEQ